MLILCCFIADQYTDHSNDGNYSICLLGAKHPQLPWKQPNSKAFDSFHQEALKQLKAKTQVSKHTKSSHSFTEGHSISPVSIYAPLLEVKCSIMDRVSISDNTQYRDHLKNHLLSSFFFKSIVSLGPYIVFLERTGKIAPLTYISCFLLKHYEKVHFSQKAEALIFRRHLALDENLSGIFIVVLNA